MKNSRSQHFSSSRKPHSFGGNRGGHTFRKNPLKGSLSSTQLIQAIEGSKLQQKPSATNPLQREVIHKTFADFGFSDSLQQNILAKNYTAPTPIQDEGIPVIMQGKDIIGIANTGTGKTAAFLLPLIDKILHNPSQRVLIIAPTRELAFQVYDEFRGFSHGLHLYGALCIGGASMQRQKMDLGRNPAFVIGTPGRIKDLIGEKVLNMSTFHNVVLDEADRMVDIGFINDIKYFISLLPKERQSLFFSATISSKVQEILQAFVVQPVTVSVKTHETADTVSQEIIKIVDRTKKMEILHELLISQEYQKVVIFGRTKWGVQKISDQLVKRGFKAGVIHGNKRQNQRLKTLEDFKKDRIHILLATDIAARGLDITGVSHVINYDIPATYEDYVHRIGRTGRANTQGKAITFIE